MTNSGALLLDLDSLAQSAHWSTSGHELTSVTESLAALCRTTVLFADEIVLTDAQVFDGAVLLRVGIDGVLDWVGATRRTTLIHVKLRAGSAAESLRMLRDNQEMRWQIVDDSGRIPEALLASQDRWARAIDDGVVASSPWQRDFNFASALTSRLHATFRSGPAAELASAQSRSAAHAAIDELSESEAARAHWRAAWDADYMGTLAEQHQCRWVSREASTSDVSANTDAAGVNSRPLPTESIPAAVTRRLRGLSPGEFGRLLDSLAHLQRSAGRRRWIDRFRLSLAVMEITRPARPLRDVILAFLRVIAFAILVGVTLGDIAPPSIDTWLLVVGGVILVVMQAPVVEIIQIASLARRDARALLREPIARGPQ